jgi:hypothetical protein
MNRILNITIASFILIVLNSCYSRSKEKSSQNFQILEFKYERHDAVGPEGLLCFVRIESKDLRNVLLKNFDNHLIFKYSGGIYDIDTLYFPKPYIDVISVFDSTLIFGQSVFGLRRFPESKIYSIILRTKKEISIKIIDTVNNNIWTLSTYTTDEN